MLKLVPAFIVRNAIMFLLAGAGRILCKLVPPLPPLRSHIRASECLQVIVCAAQLNSGIQVARAFL
jgi:hypothetical protein